MLVVKTFTADKIRLRVYAFIGWGEFAAIIDFPPFFYYICFIGYTRRCDYDCGVLAFYKRTRAIVINSNLHENCKRPKLADVTRECIFTFILFKKKMVLCK